MPRVLSPAQVEDFRERLCAAAEHLFAEHGPGGVTMRQLAAELGVSPMTPYRYFKDKDAILAAVRASGFARFAESMKAAFGKESEPVAQSREVGRAYVDFALGNPDAYRLMFDFAQPNEADYPELVEAATNARQMLVRQAEGMIASGQIEGEPVMVAHMLWAALHGAVVLQMAGKLSPGIDPARLRGDTFRAIVKGLSPA
ncbi:AcrR family transcriptional regulator [Caulobacter ginsengisoli]|uniref:AcrR family transcriptional regulator n=1 Tax=Caulobacter ginsengisoli TaxID=400775 RepID=A0ABU0IR01_9CAUL|nr:TetR/AcrR family transcriptional regulator [Caulobacter ginsengisoli]MDQ0464442.1 AcrR family transcriptional regulator [Caulobacter ginsengisoli]